MLCDAHSHARIGSVGNHWFNLFRMETHLFVKHGIVIALQRFPIRQCLLPRFPFWGIFTPFDVFECHFVRGNHAASGSHLDAEVAKRQASLHCQVADGFSCILDEIAGRSAGGHLGHHKEGDILGSDTFPQFSLDGDAHCFRACLQDTLGSHDHFHFAGADAESHRSHGTVGGCMRIPAHDSHARKGKPSFGSHHMDNAVLGIHHAEMCQPEVCRILCQRIDLCTGHRIFNRFVLVVGGRVVVRHTDDMVGPETFESSFPHALESLRAGYFVAIESVYI